MLIDHTADPIMRLAINRIRMASTTGAALARAHREVGRLLATDVCASLPLEPVTILHPTGEATGDQITPGYEPIIVAMLRSGLFLAEGLWETIDRAGFLLLQNRIDPVMFPTKRSIVLVDSIVNTGGSMRRVLDAIGNRDKPVFAIIGIAYQGGLHALISDYPAVTFVVGRVSHHTYIGQGVTDTGQRLFGTELLT